MNKKIFATLSTLLLALGIASTALAAAPKGSIGAYVWIGDAAAKNPVSAQYSYNSAGKANTVKKTGEGAYEVKLEGIGTAGGNAQVSAYGSSASHCKAVRWNTAGADLLVQVACFNQTGAPTDSQFSLLFVM
jgi:hypothetical protein